MLFHTFEFWLFFAVVLAGFYSLPLRAGKLWLLLASYIFYMRWDPRFALLIFLSTVMDYALGLLIAAGSQARKRRLLWISIVANLSILGFFKYYNFFAGSLAALIDVPPDSMLLGIVLPVGISFYTFKSMSYTVDVYKGWLAPVRGFSDYALFVVFFPELVAGPIVRADVFFPQLFDWRAPTGPKIQNALLLILVGLVKKTVFADRFAPIADSYFANVSGNLGAAAAWTGVFAFAMQIFFDFSGYTDIARGCAQLLGFKFPLNFARPYLAPNIAEFWRRWHMSLSQWLRDYLYIPLGGNRFGAFMTYRNLMLTMLLGGLWHGASWNFVLWGAYQGALLLGHRTFLYLIQGTFVDRLLARSIFMPVKIAVTFAIVLIGWVFFRARNLHDTQMVLRQMFSIDWSVGGVVLTQAALVASGVALVIAIVEEYWRLSDGLQVAPGWCRVASYVVLLFCLELFCVTGVKIPFIYFQF